MDKCRLAAPVFDPGLERLAEEKIEPRLAARSHDAEHLGRSSFHLDDAGDRLQNGGRGGPGLHPKRRAQAQGRHALKKTTPSDGE